MASFHAAKELVTMLQTELNVSKEPGNIFLAGTKSDLINCQEVSNDCAQSYANHAGCTFMAISSKNNTNVNELFTEIAKMQLAKKEVELANDWTMINDEICHATKLSSILSDEVWMKSEGFMSKVKSGLKEIMAVLNAKTYQSEEEYFTAIQKIASSYSTEKEKSAPTFFIATNANTPLKNALRAISKAGSLREAALTLQQMKDGLHHDIKSVVEI